MQRNCFLENTLTFRLSKFTWVDDQSPCSWEFVVHSIVSLLCLTKLNSLCSISSEWLLDLLTDCIAALGGFNSGIGGNRWMIEPCWQSSFHKHRGKGEHKEWKPCNFRYFTLLVYKSPGFLPFFSPNQGNAIDFLFVASLSWAFTVFSSKLLYILSLHKQTCLSWKQLPFNLQI